MELLNANNGMAPAWSPDGDRIAFLSNREAGWDLYLMADDGADAVRLTSGRSPEAPEARPTGVATRKSIAAGLTRCSSR